MSLNRKILIRFDDICPTMDFKQWNKACEILDAYNIKPLIGVIPDCKDPTLYLEDAHCDFWDYIGELQKNKYKVAMHGYQHVYKTSGKGIVGQMPRSEFAGLDYTTQFNMIQSGKKILEDHHIDTDAFFAPSHSFDRNTVMALKNNGFRYISDGRSVKAIDYGNVVMLPCRSCGVPKIKSKGYYTAIFHPNDWNTKKSGYES